MLLRLTINRCHIKKDFMIIFVMMIVMDPDLSAKLKRYSRTGGKFLLARAQMITSYSEECPASWPERFPDCSNNPVMSLAEIPYAPAKETLLRSNVSSTVTLGERLAPKSIKIEIDTSKYSIQSPIDIRAAETIKVTTKQGEEMALFFRNYDLTSQDWRLEKTRATVMLKTDSVLPFIEIPEAYEFKQAHFHWGPGGGTLIGSEHSVDGKFYTLEGHLVHESKVTPNSFAVIAILYEVPTLPTDYNERMESDDKGNGGQTRNFYKKLWNEGHNTKLEPLIEALKAEQEDHGQSGRSSTLFREENLKGSVPGVIKMESYNSTGGKPVIILNPNSEFTLFSLFPDGWDGSFYRYSGSLTTPPCSPTVTWFVLKAVARISRAQLEVFNNLRQCEHPALLRKHSKREPKVEKDTSSTKGKCYPSLMMGPNRRPTQATNYRPIFYVTPTSASVIPLKLEKPLKEIGAMLVLTYIFLKFLQILE